MSRRPSSCHQRADPRYRRKRSFPWLLSLALLLNQPKLGEGRSDECFGAPSGHLHHQQQQQQLKLLHTSSRWNASSFSRRTGRTGWLHGVRGGATSGGAGRTVPPVQRGLGGSQQQTLDKLKKEADKKDALDAKANTEFEYAAEFFVRDRRIGFVRKVYCLLTYQCLLTGALICAVQSNRAAILSKLNRLHPFVLTAMYLGNMLGTIGTLSAIIANPKLRRQFPRNVGWVTIFTLFFGSMVAVCTLPYTTRSVMMAFFQTSFAFLGLTLYAFQNNPKYDLTRMGGMLFSGVMCLIGFAIMSLLFKSPIVMALYSTFGAFLSCAFIIYDTYLVLGGKHREHSQIDSRDYVLGSCLLYQDIMNLFIHLLQLFGDVQGK